MAEENLAKKLYGAPFLLGHSDESSWNKYAAEHPEIEEFYINNSNILNKNKELILNRTKELFGKNKKAKSDWKMACSALKAKTLEPFGDSPKKLKAYLRKVNKNLGLMKEREIVNFVYDVLSSVKSDDLDDKVKKKFDAILENYEKLHPSEQVEEKLRRYAENMGDLLAKSLSGDKDAIKQVFNDSIYEMFFTEDDKYSLKKVSFASNRIGGPAGEFTNRLTDSIAFYCAGTTKEEIADILRNFRIVGTEGSKPDLIGEIKVTDNNSTIKKTRTIIVPISVKNYEDMTKRVQKGKSKAESEHFTIHSGGYMNNFFDNFIKKIDPLFVNQNKDDLDAFVTYWLNAAYLFHYSNVGRDIDTAIRTILSKYITMFAVTFLSVGISKSSNEGQNYGEYIQNFLTNAKNASDYPALFLQFSGIGIIPIYEIIEVLSNNLDSLLTTADAATKDSANGGSIDLNLSKNYNYISITYTTENAVDEVDNVIATTRAKRNRNATIKSNNSNEPYRGTKDNLISKNGDTNNTTQILKNRFDAFSKKFKLSYDINLVPENLYNIFVKYGITKGIVQYGPAVKK